MSPYEQGRAAKAHGYPLTANPYPYGNPHGSDQDRATRVAYEEWNRGHRRKPGR